MLDITSFGIGFAVAPVAYVIFGATVYGCLCAAKRLASRPYGSANPFE